MAPRIPVWTDAICRSSFKRREGTPSSQMLSMVFRAPEDRLCAFAMCFFTPCSGPAGFASSTCGFLSHSNSWDGVCFSPNSAFSGPSSLRHSWHRCQEPHSLTAAEPKLRLIGRCSVLQASTPMQHGGKTQSPCAILHTDLLRLWQVRIAPRGLTQHKVTLPRKLARCASRGFYMFSPWLVVVTAGQP